MAVNDQFDHDIRQFERRSFTGIIIASAIVGIVTAIMLVYSNVLSWWSAEFWITCAVVGLVLLIANTWLFWWHAHAFERIAHHFVTPPQKASLPPTLLTIIPDVTPDEPSEAERQLLTGLDQSNVGIVVLDTNHAIIYSNKQAPTRLGSNGHTQLDLVSSEAEKISDWLFKRDKKSIHASRVWKRVPTRPVGEPERKLYDIAASYNKGTGAETVLIFFDRTFEYLPEEDELDFISFAAHELRGPITVIKGYLDVLDDELQPVLEKDQAALMERLIVSANRLSSYINNILNASRYDRRHFQVHPVETTLTAVYAPIKDDMELRAAAQNRLLTVHFDENLPTIAADKNAIGEVMSNLIDNAIKYSNEGGQVTVSARSVPGFIEVSIADRGIGMPSNVLPNLFHKFYRSHRSRETVAGTGIGLYICRAIVDSHGGHISVRSTEHEGSTFTFTLPIYATVADKLKAGHNGNALLVRHGSGWIKNHTMFRD